MSLDYDRQTIDVMERVLRRDSNALDVGAHSGELLREMRRVAPDGRHHAFEPLPHLAARLASDHPEVTVHPLALSDQTGLATFQHVVSNPGYSGLRRRYERPDETLEEIVVPTARLDDVLPADLPVAFVKIDVEGAELQVLRGGREVLRRQRPTIVFEHGLGAADFYGTSPEQVFALLVGECDLTIWLMDAWLAGGGPLDLEQFALEYRTGRNYYFLATPGEARQAARR